MKNKVDFEHLNRWARRQKKKEEKYNMSLETPEMPPFKFEPENRDGYVAVAMTASLRNMISQYTDGQPEHKQMGILRAIVDGIAHFKDAFSKIREPIARAYNAHRVVDEGMEFEKKKSPELFKDVSCKAGCTHCCHLSVSTNEEEAVLLLADCFERNISIDWSRIEKQASIGDNDIEYLTKLTKDENRCEFLGEDKLCKVYEHRPNSCRKYLVKNDPADCNTDTRKGTIVLALKGVELAASGLMDIDHSKVGTLPQMLLRARDKMKMQHCNYCQKSTLTAEGDCTVCGLSKPVI